MEMLGERERRRITAAILGLGFVTDASVFGVVELQSVPGVGEFPVCRALGSGRREWLPDPR
jgi:hypothetical protein